jgi:hypothetical protein
MNRPVFVLGTGRCGSTLVHEVLARHEGTGFVTNLDDLNISRSSSWQNTAWRRLPPSVTKKGGARFAPTEGYRVLAREVGPVLVDPVRDLTARDATPWLRDRMVRFVEDRAERLDSPVFLHKFTGWPRTGFLRACFPDALFIEIVRDGRAVANSWLQMPWWLGHHGPDQWHFGPLPPDFQWLWEESDRSFPVLAALGWRMLMASYDEARTQVPAENWLRVRYEDVIDSPDAMFGGMLDRMGLDWTPSFDKSFHRYRFSKGRADAFRKDLSVADLAAMEAVLDKPLELLGYR